MTFAGRRRRAAIGVWIAVAFGGLTPATHAAAVAAVACVQEPEGAKVYAASCLSCRLATGLGQEGKYPPLAGSEWVSGDAGRLVRIVLHGLTGEIEVQGETWSGLMPPWGPTLGDSAIAAVTTYVRTKWGNGAPRVTVADVARIRARDIARKTPWTAKELSTPGR